MKIIEALKKTKELERKVEDLRVKISQHSAISSVETPKYPDQRAQVTSWLDSVRDTVAEIERLRVAIQRTNLETPVTIEFGGKPVCKTIAAWIHRRRDLAKLELAAWNAVTDRNLQESMTAKGPSGDTITIKIVRFYDPALRDIIREELTNEPSQIDARLEVVNAVTELLED